MLLSLAYPPIPRAVLSLVIYIFALSLLTYYLLPTLMERMRLTRIERLILRNFKDGADFPTAYNEAFKATRLHRYEPVHYAFRHLADLDFIDATFATGGRPIDARITDAGVAYQEEYPQMENLTDPLRSERFNRNIALASLIVSIFALAVSAICGVL